MEMKRAPNVKVAEIGNIKQDPDGKRWGKRQNKSFVAVLIRFDLSIDFYFCYWMKIITYLNDNMVYCFIKDCKSTNYKRKVKQDSKIRLSFFG